MSSIKFDKFKKSNYLPVQGLNATYIDLHLDFEYDNDGMVVNKDAEVQDGGSVKGRNGRDVRISPDEKAIKNSLVNLFNTRPGQRILIPDYGTNLLGMLFESVSEAKGQILGNHILQAIERWEPRVQVIKIKVIANPDEHQYTLILALHIPTLNKPSKLEGVISNEGFLETGNSEYI